VNPDRYVVRLPSGRRGVDLAGLVREFLDRELGEAEEPEGQLSLESLAEEADGAQDAEQLMAQARAILDLSAVLNGKLAEAGEADVLTELELPLTQLLARMERRGIAADRDYLGELEGMFAADMKHAIEEAHSAVGTQFNLGSPKQLQDVLFGEEENQLGLSKKGLKKTKTGGFTTDADALKSLLDRAVDDRQRRTLVALLRHRDVSKLRGTVEGLIKTVGEDGRIHTTFNQTVAATGRLSSRTRTCRTSRCAPRRAGGSARPSSWGRATTRCSPRTTARSRCGSWRTCPGTRR
jgi:DNA polymerase-1